MPQTFLDPRVPSLADYLAFIRSIGIRSTYLPDNSPWIGITYQVALDLVNDFINCASPSIYVLAVYNLGADRLINFAPDQDGQNYFIEKREDYGVNKFVPGIVASASDQGTSGALMQQEWMKSVTLNDLQYLKTPWGRQYMAWAMSYGSAVWGLT